MVHRSSNGIYRHLSGSSWTGSSNRTKATVRLSNCCWWPEALAKTDLKRLKSLVTLQTGVIAAAIVLNEMRRLTEAVRPKALQNLPANIPALHLDVQADCSRYDSLRGLRYDHWPPCPTQVATTLWHGRCLARMAGWICRPTQAVHARSLARPPDCGWISRSPCPTLKLPGACCQIAAPSGFDRFWLDGKPSGQSPYRATGYQQLHGAGE